jgi:hypothetical protein
LEIVKSPLYERQKDKLIDQKKLSEEQIDETEEIFRNTPTSYKLRPHKITCKKDKRRRSITVVPKTAYRMLYTDNGNSTYFQQVIHHKKYDRINKDC